MKKRLLFGICIILAVALMLSVCSCESAEERAKRKIREATEAYEEERDKLEDLRRQQEVIQGLIDAYDD